MTLFDYYMKQHPKDIAGQHDLFHRPYDHLAFNQDLRRDMNDIWVIDADFRKPIRGSHNCGVHDFFTMHFEGYINGAIHGYENEEMKVYDTRLYKKGAPIVFHQGFYEVIKCWDLAVYMMHTGESITIECPSKFAHGGTRTYGHFDHVFIPADTDITYKIEILECEPTVDLINAANEKYLHVPKLVARKDEKIIGTGKILQDSKNWDASTHDGFPRHLDADIIEQQKLEEMKRQQAAALKKEIEKLKSRAELHQAQLKEQEEWLKYWEEHGKDKEGNTVPIAVILHKMGLMTREI